MVTVFMSWFLSCVCLRARHANREDEGATVARRVGRKVAAGPKVSERSERRRPVSETPLRPRRRGARWDRPAPPHTSGGPRHTGHRSARTTERTPSVDRGSAGQRSSGLRLCRHDHQVEGGAAWHHGVPGTSRCRSRRGLRVLCRGLHEKPIVIRLRSQVRHVLDRLGQHFRVPNRARQAVVERVVVPVHLAQSQHLRCHVIQGTRPASRVRSSGRGIPLPP